MNTIKFIFISFIISCFVPSTKAQQAVVAAGITSTGVGGTISYSVGQLDFTLIGSNTNAGIQQAINSALLPLTWLGFSASKAGTIVLLEWETANQINCDHFIVQRSRAGLDFSAIGTVKAVTSAGANSRYSFQDKNPNKGINYYRIKQIDSDGTFTYSSIAAINFEANISVSCYPNPTSSKLNIDIGSAANKNFSYLLSDLNGKSLLSGNIGNRITTISLTSFIRASYVLRLVSDNGPAISFIIVKE